MAKPEEVLVVENDQVTIMNLTNVKTNRNIFISFNEMTLLK